ncbi:DUF2284 domain-containing protein [Desulfosporosinus sp. PR]|uniref:DUF2284 domain-containing protein n=1 Tax=Candidatus Desulfosporosinus nitrosoreducens TaxID=3401928 RepID=UPI0027E6F94A|nr:DUF2284 domain-containing protein [Desulfosporosinus sp. PR]MDQ7094431.1 DUF2284 domain-containing protein [Desulfosporosinus sp. PR]
MEGSLDDVVAKVLALGAAHAAIAEVKDIIFNEEFRTQCEQNVCGNYNKNWMCPPAVGDIKDLKARVLKFERGLLIQTVHKLENSFDWKGMMKAAERHTELFRNILEDLQKEPYFREMLPLNAGPCTYCQRCAFLDSEACRCPEQALSSVEASGIDVMALEKSCGIPYYNGKNTVSYVGLVLFKSEA